MIHPPELFNELSGEESATYLQVKEQTLDHYRNKIDELKNSGDAESAEYLEKAIKFVDDEFLFCYDGKVVMGVWGMKKRTHLPPNSGVITIGYTRYLTVRFLTDNTCSLSSTTPLKLKSGDPVQKEKFPSIIPKDGYDDPKWTPEQIPSSLKENMTYTATCSRKKIRICFESDSTCSLEGDKSITIEYGSTLSSSDFPKVIPTENYENPAWNPQIPSSITSDMSFIATCSAPAIVEKTVDLCTVKFDAGENGSVEGVDTIQCPEGTRLDHSTFPNVKANEGYTFIKWDVPDGFEVNSDYTAQALYEKTKLPWWKLFWLWLCGLFSLECRKRLLVLLVSLLLLWLFLFILSKCIGCTTIGPSECDRTEVLVGGVGLGGNDSTWIKDDPNVRKGAGGIYDPYNPYRPVPTPGKGEGLPPGMPPGVLPPAEGVLSPITEDPIEGNPSIIPNRLNILMENENKSILALAKAFKEKYPGEEYRVVYYDNVVKRMQIEIPKMEREKLKAELPSAFAPDFEIFVFDESVFESLYTPTDPDMSDGNKNWYLKRINAFKAWDITKGSDNVVVAVVDNGFNLDHPEFKGKVVMPYNVWNHNNEVYPQREDHGTHVAGIAIANADNGTGLCGIAPNCKFMPVQVADDKGRMTTTSVLDGILFALYQGADVVNVSLGGQFSSLSSSSETDQQDIIKNHFKEEERLWNEISRIAVKHRSTVVTSAGNDNILAGVEALHRPDNIIVVSAVDKSDNPLNKAEFSNYGKYSKVSAPGVSIYSSYGRNGYQTLQGTSMAAPIVTGAVALMKSLNDAITTKRVICILKNTGLAVNGKVGNLIQIDKALSMVQSDEDPDCTPQPSTGDVQLLLSWNNYNDLDLSCSDPNGEMIWFRNKRSRSGGQLEIDMNVEYPDSKNPIENIFWPAGGAPNGTYNVYVSYYKQHERNAISPFKVRVKYDNEEKVYEGILDKQNDVKKICSFVLGNANGSGDGSSNEAGVDPDLPRDGDSNASGDDNASVLKDLEAEQRRLRRELDRVENEIKKLKSSRY